MGLIFSSVWERLFNYHKEIRIVMVGLDAAGKVNQHFMLDVPFVYSFAVRLIFLYDLIRQLFYIN
jgi:hypothetical protein